MSTPRVSVALPVYQGARFLEASLRSVFAQSFRDLHVIVVDDCSTDSTAEVATQVAREYAGDIPVQVIRNRRRLGLVGNWNRCLELSTGRYSLLFHQDDVLEPDMLERSVAALEEHPDAGLAFSGYCCIDEEDRELPPWAKSPFAGVIGGRILIQALLRENFICCPAVVVPRAVYDRLGRYDRRFAFSPDFEMWLRIASHYDVVCCPRIGVRYRLHASQATEEFRHVRKVRQDLEYLTAALVGLKARRDAYPDIWRSVVRKNLWMVRHNLRASPADALWAIGVLVGCSGDVTTAIRHALLEKAGLRTPHTCR